MKKKILSMLLAVVMLFSVLPMSALSAYAETYEATSLSYGDAFQVGDIITIKSTDKVYIDDVAQTASGTSFTFSKKTVYYSSQVMQGKRKPYPVYYYFCATHQLSKISGKVATCTAIGWKDAWKCSKCSAYFSDLNGNNAIGNEETYNTWKSTGEGKIDFAHSWVDATCTTPKTCSVCKVTEGSALGHSYTVYQSVRTAATCTADRVDNYKCSRCTSTTTKTIANTAKGHTWVNATVDAPKTCSVCKTTEGNKLPSMQVSYTDPVTGDLVEFGESTNDGVAEAVGELMKTPMQKKNQIFTGWYTDNGALDKNINRFEEFTNITAGFFEIVPMAKDEHDEKAVDDYLTFELAGVQIREENTKEVDKEEVYGGLRFVASLSDDIMNNLDIIQYGFAVATRANAEANANGNEKYVIKNKDKNVRLVNCMGMTDHRKFDGNYRLYTMVIDYEGNEALKDEEMVVRPYIAYRDANGVARIFYGSYRGTNTYGGLSTSYNIAQSL